MKAIPRASLALCLCLPLLAGCMVGPDFQRPEAKVSAQWLGPAPAAPKATTLENPDRWWTAFGDPKLDSLIERAMAANLDLQIAASRIRQARASLGIAGARLAPEVDAAVSLSRSRTPASSQSGAHTGNLYRLGFDAAWELDLFGGLRRGVEAAEADLGVAEEDRRGLMVSLSAEVAGNYLNLRSLQQRLAIAQKNLAAQEQTQALTRQRFEAGFVSLLDLSRAEALAASTAGQVPLLEGQIRQTIYSLGLLLAGEPGALLAELGPAAPLPAPVAAVPTGLPSDLLLRRPDLRRAEAKIHAATARIGVARADLFPKLTISGNLGIQSSNFNAALNRAGGFWSVGPAMNWPLFDLNRRQANVELRQAVQEEELLAYQQAVLKALVEVEQALIAAGKEDERRQALARAAAANAKAAELAERLYRAGQSDFLAVLDAQRSLYSAEDALAQAELAASTHLVALGKALGGGWGSEDR